MGIRGIGYVACDVTNDLAVEAAVREVLAKAGRIDLLVNNAGVHRFGSGILGTIILIAEKCYATRAKG